MPLVQSEAAELAAGSFLEGAPVLNASAKTGAGLDELRTTLREIALRVHGPVIQLFPRLPVDRAFTMKGYGAVVTGTLVSGTISEGDELELLPSLRECVLAACKSTESRSTRTAGQRTAVNLGGIDTASIERGMVLAPIGRFRATQIIDVHLTMLNDAPRSLRSRARVRFHIHGAEALARVRVLNEGGEIAAGDSGFAQLRLEAPVIAVSGERFILRSYSPSRTIAGGQVLDPFGVKHRGKDLAQLRSATERTDKRFTSCPCADLRGVLLGMWVNGEKTFGPARWTDNSLNEALALASQTAAIVDCAGVYISQEPLLD